MDALGGAPAPFTVAAWSVGGQAQRPETTPADKDKEHKITLTARSSGLSTGTLLKDNRGAISDSAHEARWGPRPRAGELRVS